MLKDPNSVQMIDVQAAKLSNYRYPITKSLNWIAVIGYPRDRATIMWQIGERRTNHEQACCYRYDYFQHIHSRLMIILKHSLCFLEIVTGLNESN